TTGPITVAPGTANLTFNYRLQTEGDLASFDQARVQVSTDGVNFTTTVASNNGAANGGINIPHTPAWSPLTIDLSAFAGQPIVVRFRFDSVASVLNGFLGWQVEDVAFTGLSSVTGNVTQGPGGAVTVAGQTSVVAGGAVNLGQPGNDFNTVSVAAG